MAAAAGFIANQNTEFSKCQWYTTMALKKRGGN